MTDDKLSDAEIREIKEIAERHKATLEMLAKDEEQHEDNMLFCTEGYFSLQVKRLSKEGIVSIGITSKGDDECREILLSPLGVITLASALKKCYDDRIE